MLLLLFTLLTMFSTIENLLLTEPELLVNVSTGSLIGSVMQSDGGNRNFRAYRGIPYGEAPSGQLRYEIPVAKNTWEGVWDATKDGSRCLQMNGFANKIEGDEDCLSLNVYTPLFPSNMTQHLPVIFYIHGGGLLFGAGISTEVAPELIMNYDIVLVTINYRLANFGFLSDKDKTLPGNYGFLDQVLAMKWVKQNIHKFGGDPDKVIISGTSAGAWSVMLHMVSPLSKGLFHGAIAQSGSPFGKWGHVYDSRKNVEVLTKSFNCTESDIEAKVNCLRIQSAADIIQKDAEDITNMLNHLRYHAEKDSTRGSGAFLPDYPHALLESGNTFNKVPLIMGVTNDEGAFFYDFSVSKYNSSGKDYLDKCLPKALRLMLGATEENSKIIQAAIIKEYFSDDPKDDIEISRRLSRIFSDLTFEYSTDETIEKMSSSGIPVFAYRFTHTKDISFDVFSADKSKNYRTKDNVNHGEDFTYIFKGFRFPGMEDWFKQSDDDKKVSKILMELWTSFAKNLIPSSDTMNVTWTPSTLNDLGYLNINKNPFMVQGQLSPHTTFWIDIVKTLNAKQTDKE